MIVHRADAGEATIKIDAPRFRVEFWERPGPDFAWNLEAWEIEGCHSVDDVLTWMEANAEGRRHTLYAVIPPDVADYLTYVLLSGADPNVPPDSAD